MQAAEKDFLTLMSELARDSNGTDFTLICEGVSRQTHSFILRELIYLTITLLKNRPLRPLSGLGGQI